MDSPPRASERYNFARSPGRGFRRSLSHSDRVDARAAYSGRCSRVPEMTKLFFTLIALLGAVTPVQAHQIWIEQAEGHNAVIRFGEFAARYITSFAAQQP